MVIEGAAMWYLLVITWFTATGPVHEVHRELSSQVQCQMTAEALTAEVRDLYPNLRYLSPTCHKIED